MDGTKVGTTIPETDYLKGYKFGKKEAQAEIDKYKSALKAVRKSYKEKMHVNIDDIDELLNN